MTHFILVDAHQDLAYNVQTFGRNYLLSASETRRLEAVSHIPHLTGDTVLGWPDYQNGQTALIFATVFAAPRRYQAGEWDTQVFSNPAEAYPIYHKQIETYQRLSTDHPDHYRMVKSQSDLTSVWQPWHDKPSSLPDATHPVGLVLLMEGGEGVRDAAQLAEWWNAGIRIFGPVWAGTRFCGGMFDVGGFTREGYEILDGLAELGMILDISHMNNLSSLQALETYPGAVIASHSNASALLHEPDNQRHITDQAIARLIERNGVIGTVMYNKYLKSGWSKGDPRLPLETVLDHIDHVCQIAGNSLHAGIGTDIDGGFGRDDIPAGIDSFADLQKLAPLLVALGYADQDIANIMGLNWKRHLEQNLPK